MYAASSFFLTAVPDGRVFGLDQQTLISIGIQLFNAVLLALVLSRLLYKPVRSFLSKRADKINAQMSRAQEDMAEAAALKARYEEKLLGVDRERQEILEAAQKLTEEKAEQSADKARKEAEAILARAQIDMAVEREKLNEEIKAQIIRVAAAMAAKYIARQIDEETQNRLLDEIMAELEDTVWRQP